MMAVWQYEVRKGLPKAEGVSGGPEETGIVEFICLIDMKFTS